jgi:tape measure domain-containing protein
MVVRELVHIIGFRINESQLASVESRVRQLGGMMTFFTTVPIVLMGKSFLEASLKMDVLSLSVQTYSENTEQATKVTQDLKNLALELPTVKMEELAESVGPLLSRGVKVKNLVDTFRTFAVITGATGGDMKRLAKAYTDTMGKGKLAGQEVNQYINANVPIYQALQEYLNKDVATIKNMQKEGKITFDIVDKALTKMAASGGKFAGIMEKKSLLLWGIWQKFRDLLFYLESELGKKLEVPLRIILDIMGKIVTVIRTLDGNWKRFIIILMGVAAVTGPLLLIYGILTMFATPIGYIVAAIGLISLIIDDIYVWVTGGKSIMGLMFGDYKEYIPFFENLKKSFGDLFINLKETIKNITIAIGSLILTITDLDNTSVNTAGLKGLLVILTGLADAANLFLISLRGIIALGMMPFRSKVENKIEREGIMEQSIKNPLLYQFAKFGSWLGGENKLEKTLQKINDKEWYAKYPLMPFPSNINKTPTVTDNSFNPTMYLTVTAPDSSIKEIASTVKLAIQDSFENAARNIKLNMATQSPGQ